MSQVASTGLRLPGRQGENLGCGPETQLPHLSSAQYFREQLPVFSRWKDSDDCLQGSGAAPLGSAFWPTFGLFLWTHPFRGVLPNLDADFLQQLRFAHKNRLKGLGR